MDGKLKNFPCLVLRYDWNLIVEDRKAPFVLSKKVIYKTNYILRVGLKMPYAGNSHRATLFLMTTNLSKMGLKIKMVSFTLSDDKEPGLMDLKTIDDMNIEQKNNETNQLFAVPFLGKMQPTNTIITFTFYFIGITENYRINRIDGLLNRQLWSTFTNQDGTNFKLIAANSGKKCNVHKYILATRSPVFAALFSNEESKLKNQHAVLNCNEDEMNQFIKFLYTGELEGPVSHGLMQLAVKYQIKTLEKIYQIASQDVSMDQMSMIALHLDEQYFSLDRLFSMENEQDANLNMEYEANISVFTCTWKVLNAWMKDDQEVLKMSVPFQLREKKLFRAEFSMYRSSSYWRFKLKFLSHSHDNLIGRIEEVICSIDQDNRSDTKNITIKMIERETHNKDIFRVFFIPDILLPTNTRHYRSNPFSCLFTFHIQLRSTVSNYINKLMDSTWSQQLWAAAIERKMTDVEFLVGEETLGAHRSLLSARSPVFAAMFASRMKEATTGQVRIEDVDPTTFHNFLKFLYNGELEPSAVDEELFTVADKYQLETLMDLCRSATRKVDMEDVFNSFFSL